jgi:Txe/YoeB family toxin of Txe-Axe toxin-antitoxin module
MICCMSADKPKEPTKRVNMTLRVSDWDKAEALRAKNGERSVSSLIRKLIRDAFKGISK